MFFLLGERPDRRPARKDRIWNGIRGGWLGLNAIVYVVAINERPASTQDWILLSVGMVTAGFGLLDIVWARFVGRVEQIFFGPRWLLPTRLAMFLGGAAAAAYGISLL